MEKKLTLKEKIQVFIKRQPKTSGKSVIAIILVLSMIVFGSGIMGNAVDKNSDTTDYKSISAYDGNSVVKGTVVGDMMLGRTIMNKGSKYDYRGMFSGVSSLWQDSDYVSGNLECVLLDKPSDYKKNDKQIHINAETKTADVLKESGFTLINLANNHLADFCADGVVNTIDTLEKTGLDYVGAGKNITEAGKYNIQDVNGIKIATVSVSDIIPKNFSATAGKAGILSTNTMRYYQAVREASEEADLVIANIHWGVEYGFNQTERQEQLGRNLINFGADIVIGSHPHVLQPIEKYNDGIIFYSMGNFVFDQGWSRTKDSIVLNYFLDEDGNCSFEIVPVRIKDGYPTVTTNTYFKKRTYNTLTKKLSEGDYEVKSNTLLLKNAVKVDLKSKDNNAIDTTSNETDNTGNGQTQSYTEDGINY